MHIFLRDLPERNNRSDPSEPRFLREHQRKEAVGNQRQQASFGTRKDQIQGRKAWETLPR